MTISLIAGAILGWKQVGDTVSLLWFFMIALMLVVLAGISYIKKQEWVPLFLVLFCLDIGYARGRASSEEVYVEWSSKQQVIAGTVSSTPTLHDKSISFRLQGNDDILVYVKDTAALKTYHLGDELIFKGIIQAPKNSGNPDEFDYAQWLRVQGVSGICWTSARNIQHLSAQEGSLSHWTTRLKIFFLKIRTKFITLLNDTGFEGDTLAIVSALTLGDRSLLSQETKTRFADAGASHLLALSGLHLSILIGLFLPLFQGRLLMSRWRLPLAFSLFAFIWCYALLAGLPTSLVRACTMTSIFLLGGLMNHHGKPFNNLLLAAIVMVLVSPAYVFDLGAQLSFCAVLGILCFQRFEMRYEARFSPIVSIFMVSLFAQVFTLPIVALTFHQIPLYAPLFNILFIPITTILIYYMAALMLLLGLAVQFSLIKAPVSPTFQEVVTWVPNTLVEIETFIMKVEHALPGAVITDFWSRKATPQLLIYNNPKAPALHVIFSPEESYLLLGKDTTTTRVPRGFEYIASTFWKCRLTADPIVLNESGLYAMAHEHGIKEIDQLLWVHVPIEDGQPIDLLPETKLIVLDACLPYRDRKTWKRIAAEKHVPVFDCQQGAFCCGITAKE